MRLAVRGTPLRSAVVADVASGRLAVDDRVPPLVRERVAASWRAGREHVASRPVYGRSTGVGANAAVSTAGSPQAALALLRSHATSAGPPREPARVRAMLLVRANQLAVGGSGATPALLEALVAMLVADALPPVLELGCLGTGDLPPLARVGLALAGELATSAPLPVRHAPQIEDALPLMSSGAATLADAALAHDGTARLARASLVVAAASARALRANPEAFSAPARSALVSARARATADQLHAALGDGHRGGADGPARLQDPYGLRALPAVHGALDDALDRLDDLVAASTATAAENPLVLGDGGIAHHGAFHAAPLAAALDAERSALAQAAQLSCARLALFSSAERTLLPPFLGDGTPGASGTMLLEYVATSALARLRAASAPAAVQTAVLSSGAEDDASFASLAAAQALTGIDDFGVVVSCELVAAARALRMRGTAAPAPLAGLAAELPDDLADRDLTPDLAAARRIVDALGAIGAREGWAPG